MKKYVKINADGTIGETRTSTLTFTHPDYVEVDIEFDEAGKKYQNGEFVDYTPEPEPIRKITVGAFRSRFTFAEKVAVESSTDAGVKVFSADLAVAAYVNLDNSEVTAGLDYLVSQDILTEARKSEICADGSDDEAAA